MWIFVFTVKALDTTICITLVYYKFYVNLFPFCGFETLLPLISRYLILKFGQKKPKHVEGFLYDNILLYLTVLQLL